MSWCGVRSPLGRWPLCRRQWWSDAGPCRGAAAVWERRAASGDPLPTRSRSTRAASVAPAPPATVSTANTMHTLSAAATTYTGGHAPPCSGWQHVPSRVHTGGGTWLAVARAVNGAAATGPPFQQKRPTDMTWQLRIQAGSFPSRSTASPLCLTEHHQPLVTSATRGCTDGGRHGGGTPSGSRLQWKKLRSHSHQVPPTFSCGCPVRTAAHGLSAGESARWPVTPAAASRPMPLPTYRPFLRAIRF